MDQRVLVRPTRRRSSGGSAAARAREALALNRLLVSVLAASRALLDDDDLQAGLQCWLAFLAQAVDADLALLGTFDGPGPGDAATPSGSVASVRTHWQRDGGPLERPQVPATTDFVDWAARLQRGETVWAQREDLQDPASLRFWQQVGSCTMLLVPVLSGSRSIGWLCFDWTRRREWQPDFAAVLRTAADSVAAVLARHQAQQALLAEREARLAAERQRVGELARANEALRVSLDALAEAGSEDAFLRRALLELAQQSGARTGYLFRAASDTGLLRLVGSVRDGRFSAEGEAGDPPQFRLGFAPRPDTRDRLVARGRLLWRPMGRPGEEAEYTPQTLAWHRREGHAANAVHAMTVGERLVGMVGLVFDHDRPLADSQLELVHALCQPLALALELARLARQARRSAEQAVLLDERNRLAREIHDGIAQSFLAIQMQLATLPEPVAAPVAHARDLARHGLTEARRAVAALRPHELLNRDLPSAIERLLAQLTAGTALTPLLERPPAWRRLAVAIEDHLFRIVQEAANNVLRHARAQTLRVEISQAADEVTVLVADDGIGFEIAAGDRGADGGFGLEGMQQRARLIGARLQWISRPGAGTQVLVSLPSDAAARATDDRTHAHD